MSPRAGHGLVGREVFVDHAIQAEVGDRVLAIGNPFGIGETVTSGIVSAKGRHVGILADVQGYEDFIQTDAAINPGTLAARSSMSMVASSVLVPPFSAAVAASRAWDSLCPPTWWRKSLTAL